MSASLCGHIDVAVRLLERGANINQQDNDGYIQR
jgi:ankyrin repeat protein